MSTSSLYDRASWRACCIKDTRQDSTIATAHGFSIPLFTSIWGVSILEASEVSEALGESAVCINLDRISACNPLLRHQDTTLTHSTILSRCQAVQMSQRNTGGRIDYESAWYFRISFLSTLFSSTFDNCFASFFTVTFSMSVSVILYCVTFLPP